MIVRTQELLMCDATFESHLKAWKPSEAVEVDFEPSNINRKIYLRFIFVFHIAFLFIYP